MEEEESCEDKFISALKEDCWKCSWRSGRPHQWHR